MGKVSVMKIWKGKQKQKNKYGQERRKAQKGNTRNIKDRLKT
jgi:hypothetical protein